MSVRYAAAVIAGAAAVLVGGWAAIAGAAWLVWSAVIAPLLAGWSW